ncbi:MAG TPA: glycine zipper family protein [Acidovorax sp.]|nr:glycine zipper family protein [Acidovorax sp.]
MKALSLASLPLLALALTGCTVMPTGPSVMVLPGSTKSFEQFRLDDIHCRQYAQMQIGGASDAINQSAVGSAVVGTAVGALAGAALGGNHQGAAAGAGMGLLMGSTVGAGNAQSAGYGGQRGYDSAYVQCMYARGHQVPVYGRMLSSPGSPGPSYGAPLAPPPPPPGYWYR